MGEWKTGALVDIASVKMGQAPSGDSVNDLGKGTPFLQGNAEFGTKNPTEIYWCTQPRKIADIGNLLVSVRAPVGEINIADKKYCIGRGLAAIDFWGINKAFARYLFSKSIGQLHVRSQGTTFLAVSKKDIDDMVLSYPLAPAEQSKIAEVLIATDEAIDKTRSLIVKYRSVKRGLVQAVLTNGIDDQGRIRSPETHEYKDSPIGQIPVDWEATTIGGITSKVGSGATPRGGQAVYEREGILFLRSQNITFEGLLLDDVAFITERIHVQMRRSWVEKYDVLLNITGASLGRCSLYEVDQPANVNQHVCIIRTTRSPEFARFIHYWLCSYGQKQINLLMAGGNREGLNFGQIKRIALPLIHDTDELQRITAVLNTADEKIQTEQAYLAKLQDIKRGLMQDLLINTISVDTLL